MLAQLPWLFQLSDSDRVTSSLPVCVFRCCGHILSLFFPPVSSSSISLFYSSTQGMILLSLSLCLLPLLLTLTLSRGSTAVSVSVSPPRKWLSFIPLLCQPAPAAVLCRSERDNGITPTVLLSSLHAFYHPSIYLSTF